MRSLAYSALLLVLFTCWTLNSHAAAPFARVADGKIQGLRTAHNTEAFLGIPYAAAPVGYLRWKAPRSPAPWFGTLNATKLPVACPQKGNFFANVPPEQFGTPVGNEDCLYLNLWKPVAAKKRPVVLWIHGGSNFKGTSADPLYDGAWLASSSDVVFVSANYRLGMLGALAHEALNKGSKWDSSGNYVTLDLVAVLKWIHANIEIFGGDPDNITIMGQSAGCMNVWGLLQTPLSKDLFHRAVCSAGVPNAYPRWVAEARSEDFIENLVVNAGLVKEKSDAEAYLLSKGTKWIRQFLYSRTTEELVQAQEYIVPFQHFKDDAVFPHGVEGILFGSFHRVPLILGLTTDEATYLLGGALIKPTDKELWSLIQNPPADLKEEDLIKDDKVTLYHSSTAAGSVAMQMTMEEIFWAVKAYNPQTYRYSFEWKETPSPWKEVFGAVHGMDAMFYLGNFETEKPSFARFAWTEQNRQSREALRDSMAPYFKSFFWDGNPNTQLPAQAPVWDGRMVFK
ncbi:carboxylesterase/lipase family protein [Bdellovibrio bacteriovorus]|uniref:carboxylesterase/lipase family protein n=1 Tax=Bdellovibrio bacteriovorus TaxID=959 RepID=UPI003AA9826C